jgi:2-dehydropantoate 2-reductase
VRSRLQASAARGLTRFVGRDANSRSGGRPSLLQDVMRGRRTEIDYLNGYVVDEARRLGVPVPFNEAIVEIYRRHGVGALKPDPRNLDPLLEKLR